MKIHLPHPTAGNVELTGPVICSLCAFDEGREATCIGVYDAPTVGPLTLPTLACDACCGHSQHNGWCQRVTEKPATQPFKRGDPAQVPQARRGDL